MTTSKTQRPSFRIVTFFAMLALAFTACDSVDLEEPGIEANAEYSNPRLSSSPIYTFADMSEVGSSTLKRGTDAVSLSIQTSNLEAGYTYTVWWVVFDKPELCSPPACGEDDVFEDAMAGGPNLMELTILGAADGSVVPDNGKAHYSGALRKFDASSAILGDGMDNPETAEIHYVIRSHGAAIPGLVEEQITTFNGGCNAGQPNEGQCADVQFAIHKAKKR